PVIPATEPAALTREWDVGVIYCPHGAPDFFVDSDIETLFSTAYELHFNSARTGVRLIGDEAVEPGFLPTLALSIEG
ncbi:hypothetical protein ACC739_38355, partial [Rhizobium ruizarguesonis]